MTSKFTLNEAAWASFERQVAEGFQLLGEAIVNDAGKKSGSSSVARSGGAATFVNGRRVAGNAELPRSVKAGGGVTVVAGFGSPISHLIELGTAPHAIHVRNKKVLADGTIFGTDVRHPGTRARPFLSPSFLGMVGRIGSFVRIR